MSNPLVSVLTPVYNGEEFLVECIESVLAQDYDNWEYHILDNCSTDRTAAIAQSYAARDHRIRVTLSTTFVNVAENHNRAFRLVSPESRYCKVVSADDWILPGCVRKMVQFGLAHPTVGIISAYQRSGKRIRWQELPTTVDVLPGREACRLSLLTGVPIFGAPTAFLYRSDLVRGAKPFFPSSQPHADTSACYEALQYCDFGVLHELLSVERVHDEQVSSKIEKVGAGALGFLEVFGQYGPRFLSAAEYETRKSEVFDRYYRYLGGSILKLEKPEFWRFQRTRLAELGHELDWSRVAAAALKEGVTEVRTPATAARKVIDAIGHVFRSN
jgi:glycosyltransferase involved in cell wall biosynthesis